MAYPRKAKLEPLPHASKPPTPYQSKAALDNYFKEHGITALLKDLTTDLAVKRPHDPIRYLYEMLGICLGNNGSTSQTPQPSMLGSNALPEPSDEQLIRFHVVCQGRYGATHSHFVRRSTKHVANSVVLGWLQEAVEALNGAVDDCFQIKQAQTLKRNLSASGISDEAISNNNTAPAVCEKRDSIGSEKSRGSKGNNFDSFGRSKMVDHVVEIQGDEQLERRTSQNSNDPSNVPTPRETLQQIEAKNEETMLAVFRKYDRDKTNNLDKNELAPILRRYQILNDEVSVQRFLANMDDSEKLTFAEFKQLLQRTKNEVASLHLGKFHLDPNFRQGRFGDMTYFDNGIVYLLGTPDLQFLRAIYAEHCILKGSKEQFKAPNTGIVTTPFDEFFFVAGEIDTERWTLNVDKVPWIGEENRGTRTARPLREFMEHEYAVAANLRPEELLVGRLYTGPMYYKYNNVVRTDVEKLWSGSMNTYTTTIHVLTSLLMKLSRVSKIPRPWKVYRGMGNTMLPEEFFAEDHQGCKGGVEFGFMSTTLDPTVALEYSGRDRGKELPTIFEIEIGKTTMGSDVSWFSQFPQEKEILYPPLTHLEVNGEAKLINGVCVVHLRPTVNQNAQTLEQIEEENKTDLVQIAESLAMDMLHAATKANVDDQESLELISKTEKSMVNLINQHEAGWYNDMGNFSSVFNEVVRKQEKGCRKVAEIICKKAEDLKNQKCPAQEVIDTFYQAIDFWHLVPDSKERRESVLFIRKAIVELSAGEEHNTSRLLLAKHKQRLAEAFKRRGEYSPAFAEMMDVVELIRTERGVQSSEAATALNELAIIKRHLGDYDEALLNHVEAMNILEAVKGAESTDVGKVAHDMGKVYRSLGLFVEALDSYRKALKIHQKAEHILQVAATLSDIGDVFLEQGNFKMAVKHIKQALDMRQNKLGEDSKEVAKSLSAMGEALQLQGKYDDALESFSRASKILKKTLGKEHLDVATVLERMGRVCIKKADFEKGLKYYDQSLRLRRRIFGDEHLSVATTVSRIAWAMSCTGNFQEALQQYFQAINITREVVGHEHPEVARQLIKCGTTYEQLLQFSQAMTAYEEAIKIQRNKFGDSHTEVAACLDKIAGVFRKQEDFDQAMNNIEEAIRIRKSSLGHHHPDLGSSLLDMADLYISKQWHDEAMRRLNQAQAIFRKSLDNGHPLIGRSLFSMARLHRAQGNYDEALKCHDEALKIRKETLGWDHPEYADSLENRAQTLEKLGDLESALASHQEALTVRIQVLGQDHPDVAKSLESIARYHKAQGHHDTALEHQERVLQILEKVFGAQHLHVSESRASIAETCKILNRNKEALSHLREAQRIKQKILGENHPEVAEMSASIDSFLNLVGEEADL